MRTVALAGLLILVLGSCGSDADDIGVGAECTKNNDCNQDTDPPLKCLTGFKGGYCGLSGCTGNDECPEDSLCVTHEDSTNYCFRSCKDKAECNENRDVESESNCSSNITRVDDGETKACVPPSGV
jgi:hypothetical protein